MNWWSGGAWVGLCCVVDLWEVGVRGDGSWLYEEVLLFFSPPWSLRGADGFVVPAPPVIMVLTMEGVVRSCI
jgi:hypothetical protein